MKNALRNASLSDRVIALIESARQKVASAANLAQVYTNYEIGRQIVEEEQGGKRRAAYGEKILIDLSAKLTSRFGKGWSVPSLKRIRQFFLTYSNWINTVEPIAPKRLNSVYPIGKSATLLRKFNSANSLNTVYPIPQFALSWSHYLVLMRIVDPKKRAFYEVA